MGNVRGFALGSEEAPGWRLFQFDRKRTKTLVRSGLLQTEEIYSPMLVLFARSRHKRGTAQSLVLAFPGYLFIRQGASSVPLSDEGISCSPVMLSGQVAVIDEAEMERIRSLEQRWLQQQNADAAQLFSVGDLVLISSGPFAGVPAVVKRAAKGNSRAILTLSGSSIDFEISCFLLDKRQA